MMEKLNVRCKLSLVGLLLVVFGFITVHSSEPLDVPDETLSCPDGWVKLHRGCYKFETTGQSWEDAADVCKAARGELTSIQSAREKEEVEKHLTTHFSSYARWWVGFSRKEKKGTDWRWMDDTPVSTPITPWLVANYAGRPGNVCGMLEMQSGAVNPLHISVTRCSSPQPFICEFHTITPRPSTTISTTQTDIVAGATISTLPPIKGEDRQVNDGDSIGDMLSSAMTISSAQGQGRNTIPSTMASKEDRKPPVSFSTSATRLNPLTATSPGSESEGREQKSSVPPPGEIETESTVEQPDETLSSVTPHTTYVATSVVPSTTMKGDTGDPDETDEDDEDQDAFGKGSLITSRPTETSRPTRPDIRRPTRPSRPSPTSPAWARPATPRPTMVDWDEAFEEFEGCYIPGTGGSLRETVMAARRFYGEISLCPAVRIGSISWSVAKDGETATAQCNRGDSFAEFECGGDERVCWRGQPDITGCANKKLQSLLEKVESPDPDEQDLTMAPPTIEESIELSSQLVEVTETEETTMEDVMVTSQVLTALTKKRTTGPSVSTPQSKEQVQKIVDNVVKAGSNLVSSNKSAMWEEMSENDKVRSASSLLVAMETATVSMAEEIDEPTVITQKDENIELELRVVDVEELEKEDKKEIVYGSEQSENTFSIPMETLKSASKGKLAKAVFMTHYSMADILGGKKKKKAKASKTKTSEPGLKTMDRDEDGKNINIDDGVNEVAAEEEEEVEDEGPQLASYILSASLGGETIMKLPKPISFTMRHLEEVDPKYIPLCSFWNVSDDSQLGFWSQDGCRVVTTNKSHTTCECDHMTNFAILLDVHGMEMTKIHRSMLRLVTIIGCVISCVSLLASWVTFQCLASLQGERNSIHKNLAATLLVAEILFVFGIDQAQHQVVCSVIAGFLHYFFLAAFTWMFIEGLHIIFMLVQVFDSSRSRLPYYYITGYGAPLVVVGASCLFYYRGYGTEQFCWLTTERYFIWAFAGPVAIILLVNALFLAYAMSTVCRHADYVFSSKEKATGSGIRAWIQGALALEVLLGLTWTLGYFMINDESESVALAYIFAILNSLQGLFIFVFHCLLNKKAQKEYRSVVRAVVTRTTSSAGTHSTFTKRTSNTHNQHDTSNTHNRHEDSHTNNHHELNNSPTGSHQKLNATNSHSMA